MRIVTEQATVFRAPGRRYLTKAAAYQSLARQLVKEKHWDAVGPNPSNPYEDVYGYDIDVEDVDQIVKRLARYLRWLDSMEVRKVQA